MLCKEIRDSITQLIRSEVVPAVGCTEPAAVSLAVAKATETLGSRPYVLKVSLSGNILKNAMGVGIPGTGMIGLPIAIALGSLIGKSSYGLEVLKDVNDEVLPVAKEMIEQGCIKISHASDCPSNLFIDATALGRDGSSARAVIAYSHTTFVLVEKNGNKIYELLENNINSGEKDNDQPELDLAVVWEYATESPLDEIAFIKEAQDLNTKAAEIALKGEGMGHKVGKTIYESHQHFGDSRLMKMLAFTAGACDARMAGEPIAVMSNSGSGNQGIAITMPVVAYAEEIKASDEQTLRALAMAHLTSIYIKQSLGRLSALCGCIVASTGASMALVYLMGGGYEQGSWAVKNMIATLTGMICDGAKPACSLKIASGVSTAYISAVMAMNGECVTSNEGIIDDCVDETIKNFSAIGRDAMRETDKMVLRIMSDSER